MEFTKKELKKIEILVSLGDSKELAEETVISGRENERKRDMQLKEDYALYIA